MQARNQLPRKSDMSTDTVIQYMVNAGILGLATGIAAAIVAYFVAR
jgi:hypothetical protein